MMTQVKTLFPGNVVSVRERGLCSQIKVRPLPQKKYQPGTTRGRGDTSAE